MASERIAIPLPKPVLILSFPGPRSTRLRTPRSRITKTMNKIVPAMVASSANKIKTITKSLKTGIVTARMTAQRRLTKDASNGGSIVLRVTMLKSAKSPRSARAR